MRLDRYFAQAERPTGASKMDAPIPLQSFAFGPIGQVQNGQWSEIYRLAYERTIEALRPTGYDHAMKAFAN